MRDLGLWKPIHISVLQNCVHGVQLDEFSSVTCL